MSSLLLNKNGKIITNEEGKPYKTNGSTGGDFDGKKITLKDEDNGFTIDLDASSGHIKINDGVHEAIVNPYQIMIKQGGDYIDLHIDNGICYNYDGSYSALLRNGIETENEEDGYRYFYFPKKDGTLALEEQMQEMIVDVEWDGNNEAYVELGKNVIDWSRLVYLDLYSSFGTLFRRLEWSPKFTTFIDPIFQLSLGPDGQDDFTLGLYGWYFTSSGNSQISDRYQEYMKQSFIMLNCYYQTIDNQLVRDAFANTTKIKLYYYPVKEKSPSMYFEN